MTSLDEIADTIEAFPDALEALLTPVSTDALRLQPAPGEWCPLEVIGHLIVTDGPGFRDRIAGIINGEPQIAAFDPSLELTGRDFREAHLDDLVRELRAERALSGSFLRLLDPLELRRTAEYAPHGRLAAGDFVHEWSFHDQDHLQQILAVTKSAYLTFMTKPMRRALLA